ncbi:MAG TPA: protein kinase [Vicinamibacterales bacterium]
MTLQTGQTLGQYRVVRHLGSGSMGDVYHAVDEPLDRDVALKVVRAGLDQRTDLVDRFKSEARTLARLDHPHIARLYGLLEQPCLFMVMEFVRGETLLDRLSRFGPLRWREAVTAVSQVLEALEYAHRLGIVHRDIKPGNVMVRGDEWVKVTDFGIARVLGSERQTVYGHVIGTLAYMAPEQIRGDDVTASADLYSTGALLYELLTARTPFQSSSEWDLMQQHMQADVPAVQPLAGDVPRWMDDVVRRAMAKTPADRFESASAFRAELERLAAAEPLPNTPGTRFAPLPGPPAQPALPTRVGAALPTRAPAPPSPQTPVANAPVWQRLGWRGAVGGAAALIVIAGIPFAIGLWRRDPVIERAAVSTSTPAQIASAPSFSSPPAGAPLVPPGAPVASPRAPVASPAVPPAVVPPGVEARKFPLLQFENVDLVVTENGRTREQPVILRLGETTLGVRDESTSNVLRSVPYDAVKSASYRQTEHSTFKIRTKRHWLTLRSDRGEFMLRLDKNNYESILAAIEERTIKVSRTIDPVKGK